MERIVFREDPLGRLASTATCQEKLGLVHEVLRQRSPGVDRVSVALYDEQAQTLRTFLASPAEESPLSNYEVCLAEHSSLVEAARTRAPRIVNDLRDFSGSDTQHSRAISGQGFASSYTQPMFRNGTLTGFVFLDSLHNRYFTGRTLEQVELFVRLLAEMVLAELAGTRGVLAALQVSLGSVQCSRETPAHMERVSRYARLAGRNLAGNGLWELDDERVEMIGLFAAPHDLGMLCIPAATLQKTTSLSAGERELLRDHPLHGRRMIDEMVERCGLSGIPYLDILRNIIEQHHETLDGSGYPRGLEGDRIALEARIVAVCDVFDALTTRRSHKGTWNSAHAFAMLRLLAIDKLDGACVEALADAAEEVVQVQALYCEQESISGETVTQ